MIVVAVEEVCQETNQRTGFVCVCSDVLGLPSGVLGTWKGGILRLDGPAVTILGGKPVTNLGS